MNMQRNSPDTASDRGSQGADSAADLPLRERHCPPSSNLERLDAAAVDAALAELPDWRREDDRLIRRFTFRNFHETMAFVNAVAWIAHREDHHPDLTLGYRQCTVQYSTHSVGGLSINDLICAARVDSLVGNGQ